MNRKALLLVAAVGLVALVAVLFLMSESGPRASNRTQAEFATGTDGRPSSGGAGARADGVADAARLRELIENHGGFTTRGRVLLVRPDGPGAGLDVVLRGQVAGLVVEATGRTDPDGRFLLPALPRQGDFALTVTGELVQELTRRGLEPEGDVLDAGDLELDRYYFVAGQVLGEGRRGVAGVDVRLIEAAGSSFSFLRSSQRSGQEDPVAASAETDAAGKFRIRLSDPGVFTVGARADGWASHYRTDVTVGGVADTEVKIVLTRGYEVVGYVLDAAGRPVSGAAVSYLSANFRSWSWPKEVFATDGTGRFGFRVEPRAREYILSATTGAGLDLSQRFSVPLTEDLVLRAPGAGVLAGRVVDAETSQPVANAEVLLTLSRQPGMSRGMPDFSKAVATDAYGAFRVEGVGDLHFQSISVRADGYADLRLAGMFGTDPQLWNRVQRLRPSADREVAVPDLPLTRGRTLSGTVTDAAKKTPVGGATVELWDFVMGNRETTTDEGGRYRFDHVGDRVAMIVVKDGYAPFRESPWPGFELKADAQEAQRDLAIEPGGTVEGRVRTRDGEPVPRALVRLEAAESGWRNWTVAASLREIWTYTDTDGRFRLDAVPPVKVRAQAEASGFDVARSKDVEVATGKTVSKVDVTLLPAAILEGQVVARDGTPVRAVRVTVTRDPGKDASDADRWRALGAGVSAFSDTKGRFHVEGVPVGDVLIRTEADGFATATVARKGVEPGATLQGVRLELAPSFTITGKVVNAKGEPVLNCWVRVRHTSSPDGEPDAQVRGERVQPDGTFTVDDLPAGTFSVEVRVSRWGAPTGVRYENLTRPEIAAGTKDLVLELAEAPAAPEPG